MRKNISTNTPSETRVGYSRAVIFDNTVYVSGTTAMNERGETVGATLYEQTKFIFEKIKKILEDNRFTLNDVLVIRAYVTKMDKLLHFDEAFKETFFDIKPTCTLVGISSLVKPDLLIEVECIARK